VYKFLPVKVLNPFEIGADLVANAVAAFQKYGKLTMVIDFGTALTFTTIGENAEILGVAIAPGLRTAVSALARKTAQLPEIHLVPPPSVLGENTIHAIQSGVVFGFTGLVDYIIERTQTELNEKLTVVATGGLSSVIAPLTKNVKTIEPLLTLDGLYYINSIVNSR
jgi:type III pantothenate kinase